MLLSIKDPTNKVLSLIKFNTIPRSLVLQANAGTWPEEKEMQVISNVGVRI